MMDLAMSSGTTFGPVSDPMPFVLPAWQFLPVCVCLRVQNIGSFSVFRRALLVVSNEPGFTRSNRAHAIRINKKNLDQKKHRHILPAAGQYPTAIRVLLERTNVSHERI